MKLTGSCICHGEKKRGFVLDGESFILEFGSIDRLAASTVTSSEITTLVAF